MTTNNKPWMFMIGLAIGLLLSGCVALQENIGKAVGTTVGAGLGLVGCRELGGSDAECTAAAVAGGVVGYSLGNLFDERRQRLAAAARETNADVEFETIKVSTVAAAANPSSTNGPAKRQQSEGLVASIRQAEMFIIGSSQPTESAVSTLSRLASIYAEQFALDDGTKIETRLLIVGHADATGGARRNQVLSERRATSIAAIFHDSGLPAERLYVSGAGSSQPVANNATIDGRQQNRRVEILEISNEEGLVSYSDFRKSDPRFLEHSTRNPEQEVAAVDTPVDAVGAPESGTARRSEALIDFAGMPANDTDTSVLTAIGTSAADKGLLSKLLPTDSGYEAGDSVQPSVPCVADSPRISGSVVNYASRQEVSARPASNEYMPGMDQRSWQSLVNGHLVSVSPVSVLEPNGQPASNPVVFIQEDYSAAVDTPSTKVETLVETYMSTGGVLYRMYALEAGTTFYCADLAMPLSEPFIARGGKLYYKDGPRLFEQTFEPSAASLE